MPETNNTTKILLAIIAGAAAGIAIGVLLAPDKGSETRKKIKEKAEDLVQRIKDEMAGNGSADSSTNA